MRPRTIAYFAGTAGNWGGASRVLFTNLKLLDRSRFTPVVLLSGHGPAEKLLRQLGITYQIWGPLTEYGRPFAYFAAVIKTLRWLRKHDIELVHLNRANDWRPAEILAMRLAKIPIVTHFHTVNIDHAPATRWSSAIAAVSNYVARHSDLQGVAATVIHNSVDLARFSQGRNLRGQLGIGPQDTVVTFVGQIRRIKGVDDFVAMAQCIEGRNICFLIAGNLRDRNVMPDSYSEEELNALISSDNRIRYCGYLEAVEDLYRTSDIVVAPSNWQEPFGLVCIEAGAASLPLVATRVGGIPEIIDDGVNGVLVSRGDIAALVKNVQQLVNEPELRLAMGNAARQRVERDFTERPVRALEDLYKKLLDCPKTSS